MVQEGLEAADYGVHAYPLLRHVDSSLWGLMALRGGDSARDESHLQLRLLLSLVEIPLLVLIAKQTNGQIPNLVSVGRSTHYHLDTLMAAET